MPLFAYHPLWRLVFWISYAAWIAFETWVFSRDRRKVSGERKDKGSLLTIFALIFLAIGLAFTAVHVAPFARIRQSPSGIFAVGIALIWLGLALRLWAILTLGRFFRYTVTVQDQHRLITAGPYRLLRHPSYTGALLTIAGMALAMGNWLSLAGALGCSVLAYGSRMGVEERALGARFGETFAQYRARTWAILPGIW